MMKIRDQKFGQGVIFKVPSNTVGIIYLIPIVIVDMNKSSLLNYWGFNSKEVVLSSGRKSLAIF